MKYTKEEFTTIRFSYPVSKELDIYRLIISYRLRFQIMEVERRFIVLNPMRLKGNIGVEEKDIQMERSSC